jgi:prevent-host-death family protein
VNTISQRELRNDNAKVIREVEAGGSFLVTKNGIPVAVLRPADGTEQAAGLPLARAAQRRIDFRDWPRVPASDSVTSAEVLADLRAGR